LKGLDRSFFAHPEQTGDAEIDLVDQRQVFMAFGVLDFIDADGVDRAQRPMSRPQVTTCSTASKTLSQDVRNDSAVSFQESRRAQRARKSI
jgi:hypothetical protein